MNKTAIFIPLFLTILLISPFAIASAEVQYDRIHPPPRYGTIVLSVDLTPDGKYLAISYYRYYRGVAIIDTETMNVTYSFTSVPGLGGVGTVTQVSWSPDGELLGVTIGVRPGFGGIVIYRLNKTDGTLEEYWRIINAGPRSVAWSPDGTKVAFGFDHYSPWHHNLKLYYRNGTLIWSKYINKYVWHVSWTPDGKYLVLSMRDLTWNPSARDYFGALALVNASNGDIIWMKILPSFARSTLIMGDPPRIYVGGNFGKILIYDLNGNLLAESPYLGNIVEYLELLPNERIAAAVIYSGRLGTYGGMGRLLILDSNLTILWEKRYCNATVTTVSYSDPGLMAWGGGLGYVYIGYDLGSIVMESESLPAPSTAIARISETTVAAGEGWIAGVSDGKVAWNNSITGYVTDADIVGNLVVISYAKPRGGGIIALNPSTGEISWQFETPGDNVTSIDVDGYLIAAGTSNGEVYFIYGEKVKSSWILASNPITDIAWDRYSRMLAIATSDGKISVYRVGSTAEFMWSTSGDHVAANPALGGVAVSWLYNVTLYYWNGTVAWTRPIDTPALELEWSPGLSRLAVVTQDGLVVLDHTGEKLFGSCTFNALLGTPAQYTNVVWWSDDEHLDLATVGSSWITTLYTGPYPSLSPLATYDQVGGVIEVDGVQNPTLIMIVVAGVLLFTAGLVSFKSRDKS